MLANRSDSKLKADMVYCLRKCVFLRYQLSTIIKALCTKNLRSHVFNNNYLVVG